LLRAFAVFAVLLLAFTWYLIGGVG
jgi:hypothetical protein